jgi:hypothetical protein
MVPLKKSNLKSVLITIGILLIINTIGSQFFYRFDLTKEDTLSSTSLT